MSADQRQSQRISEFMPVSVFIRNAGNEVLAGPFSGRIIDLSRNGAGLLLSRVQSETWHVYHSLSEDSFLSLHLIINQPEQGLTLTLDARPVWLNTFEHDELQERVMGVAFLKSGNHPEAELIRSFSRTP